MVANLTRWKKIESPPIIFLNQMVDWVVSTISGARINGKLDRVMVINDIYLLCCGEMEYITNLVIIV